VGLAAVEDGAEKPLNLNISWEPIDRVAAARKARKFAVQSMMVQAVEAINQYIDAVSHLPRFLHLRKSWTDNDASMAERLVDFSGEVLGDDLNYEVYCVALMIHWRNRFVHVASSAKLKYHEKKVLHESEQEAFAKYCGLSIDCLLCHFEEMKPKLKDVTSLISMTLNTVSRIDELIYRCDSKEDVDVWLKHYKIDEILDKVLRQTKSEKVEESTRKALLTLAPHLVAPYFEYVWPHRFDM